MKDIIARHVFKNRGTIAIVTQVKSKCKNIPEFLVWTNRKCFSEKAADWAEKIICKHPVCVVYGESGTMILRGGMIRNKSDFMLV